MAMRWCGAMARRVAAAAAPAAPSCTAAEAAELCGRGDKRTKRGKIFKGSYGNARPKKKEKIARIKDKVEAYPGNQPFIYTITVSSSSSQTSLK
ncbi:hypothetical protein Scep_002721 [Stephania cephalantha]|uniref:30S ribosomal protein S31, mitochondrial n=1 Tax=Stephania cephalantha TaxID=152367 RepID=A0AAP0Q4V8_9MAGN